MARKAAADIEAKLAEQLTRTRDRVSPVAAPPSVGAPAPPQSPPALQSQAAVPVAQPQPGSEIKAPPSASDKKSVRTKPITVSLYPEEIARAEKIVTYFFERGRRVSLSQAVSLALRCAPIDTSLIAAADRRREADQRR